MSRDQDVKCIARVLEQVSPPDAEGRGAVWALDTEKDQQGEHLTGRHELVTARRILGRQTMRTLDSGVRVRPGDRVAVLVNPWIDRSSGRVNRHVCAIIGIIHAGTR